MDRTMRFPFRLPAAILVAICAPAQAQDCKPLALVTHVKMGRTDSGLPLVPVTINGTPRNFLFDTGGGAPEISATLVDELKLRHANSQLKTYDVNGHVSSLLAEIDSFALGPLRGTDVRIQMFGAGNFPYDGLLTPHLYPDFDIDVDFGSDRFAYFSQDRCPGHVVYWKAAAVAVVPIRQKNLHIYLTVTLDGKEMEALLDTGASLTYLDMRTAGNSFNITPQSPGMVQDGFVNGDNKLPIYHRTFSTLSLEGINIRNPSIAIAANRLGRYDRDNDVTGSHTKRRSDQIKLPTLILGMNILRKLHMFIALKENKLYITPAGAPDAPSPFETAAPSK